MKNLNTIVFFGTHELAVPALDTMAGLELTPKLVVPRPQAGLGGDDPAGSASRHEVSPVRAWAREHGVDAVRSRRAAEPALHERIAALEPDLVVVADYGRALPPELLDVAARGAIEVHPSLLPKLRGEHALRGALAGGLNKTGVTVFQVAEEPWGGPVLFQEELEIGEAETFGELFPRAQELGSELLAKALQKVDRGKGKPKGKAQNAKIATRVPRFGGRHRRTPWAMKASQVYDRLRAYTPPGLIAHCRYRPLDILAGKPMEWVEAPYGTTGTYLGMRNGKLAVLCGDATVFGIERLRRPGDEPSSASVFARAEELRVGDRFI